MRNFGLFMCILGVAITAAGVILYYGDNEGQGVAGFVLGVGLGAIGVMVFLTDFLLRFFERSASLMIRFQLCKLRFELHGELGTPLDYEGVIGDRLGESKSDQWTD
ncbi:MAG: hypothetical protein JSV02_00265 [Dehalococcoidia bacterium]|nr:MAG: hypothetical protein JSV02_00265 [Dehalococcoidia bacterium]